MSAKTGSTVNLICLREAIVNQELPEEAVRILRVYNDPAVPADQKAAVRQEIDKAIDALESRVTTRRLNEVKG